MELGKVFLVGLPGSGKTTLGKELSKQCGIPFIDLDEEIIKLTNQSIHSIFETMGEEAFREIERDQLKRVINSTSKFILATGGGTPCFHGNMDLMNKHGLTVALNTPVEIIEERLKNDSSRPLLKKHNLHELQQKRASWYGQAQRSITSLSDLKDFFS